MSQYILAKYDVSGIQSYIFASRQLRENVGASQNVGRILRETLPGILTEWAMSCPDTVRTNWEDPKNWGFSLPKTEELLAEILYIGGGNAFVVYREETAYNQVSRLFAMKMMEQCQGVTVLSAHVEANPDNFPGDLERLNQEMAQIKRRLRRPQPLSSYAVVEQDGFDGSPVTHLEIRGEASTKLSELRYEKRRDSLSNGAKTQPGRYALEMEDLAEQKGENSYIAVIHIDGNNMGELVQKLMDQNPTYETAVPAMRQLSAGIAQRNRQASEAMETAFASVFDRETLPLRPLIMDGDDMTFLCCCKAGIGAAVACLRRLLQLSDQKLPLSACAGIAFVHNHFPFSIAYDAAEACCSRAKNRWYQEKDDKTAYLDFQVVQGAFVKGFKDEAQLETLRVRPFRVAEKVDLRSEDSIDCLRQTLGRMVPDGGIQGQWPMTRLRRLYQAYRLGQDHVDLLKKEYASRGYTVSQLTGARAGVSGRKDGGIFDALETLDFYNGNIWRGFWEAVDKEDAL